MLQYERRELFFCEQISMNVFHNYSVSDFLWPPHHGLLLHLLHVTEESHGGIYTNDTNDKIDVNISIDGCDKE